MKAPPIPPNIEYPVTSWDEQTGYPNEVENGTPEHHGAHERLWILAVNLESDYEPYGKGSREAGDNWHRDCSCGCRHYAILDGPLGADWGVCMNQNSPRAGLLTFEHQGCLKFEAGPDDRLSTSIIARAENVFGDKEKAWRWLHAPKHQFDGKSPVEILATADGRRRVGDMLTQIEHGIFS